MGQSFSRVSIPQVISHNFSVLSNAIFSLDCLAFGKTVCARLCPRRESNDDEVVTVTAAILGGSGVGKTCLRNRWIEGRYTPDHPSTIGVDLNLKSLKYIPVDAEGVKGRPIPLKVTLYDTSALRDRNTSLEILSRYLRSFDAIVLVYDVKRPETLSDMVKFMDDPVTRESLYAKKPTVVLVGNKSDVGVDERKVGTLTGEEAAREMGAHFAEASALAGVGVSEAFMMACRGVMEARLEAQLKRLSELKAAEPHVWVEARDIETAQLSERHSLVGTRDDEESINTNGHGIYIDTALTQFAPKDHTPSPSNISRSSPRLSLSACGPSEWPSSPPSGNSAKRRSTSPSPHIDIGASSRSPSPSPMSSRSPERRRSPSPRRDQLINVVLDVYPDLSTETTLTHVATNSDITNNNSGYMSPRRAVISRRTSSPPPARSLSPSRVILGSPPSPRGSRKSYSPAPLKDTERRLSSPLANTIKALGPLEVEEPRRGRTISRAN